MNATDWHMDAAGVVHQGVATGRLGSCYGHAGPVALYRTQSEACSAVVPETTEQLLKWRFADSERTKGTGH